MKKTASKNEREEKFWTLKKPFRPIAGRDSDDDDDDDDDNDGENVNIDAYNSEISFLK